MKTIMLFGILAFFTILESSSLNIGDTRTLYNQEPPTYLKIFEQSFFLKSIDTILEPGNKCCYFKLANGELLPATDELDAITVYNVPETSENDYILMGQWGNEWKRSLYAPLH
ncbi:hypothetical protein ACVNS2_19925 [Paenibacillus caseinilyticus]|uniref:Uncharacterized protein n=1 Tax=Paenibacillus mucilaginosus K02 TaxID=997761 RepID=I0BKM8_9BACL|nr:hypothetical protein [Paenibacillus mucilaginosus]AFH62925.1 hypothetical protein B2K_19790 [Paenibacillus mucilaginosus K02]